MTVSRMQLFVVRQCLLVVAAMMVTGCGAFDFDIEEVTQEVVLEGDLQAFRDGVALPTDIIPTTVFEYDIDDDPAGIHIKEATLSLTDTVPSARDMTIPFSFIETIEFWIHGLEGSHLGPVRIAWLDAPGPGHDLGMSVDSAPDLTPYVKEGFEVRGVMRGRIPAADLSFRARVVLGVDVF